MKETSSTDERLVLNTIINNIPAMVFYKNLEGVYIFANEMFCKQLGTNSRDIVGKSDFDFFPEDVARRENRFVFRRKIASIESGRSQLANLWKDLCRFR